MKPCILFVDDEPMILDGLRASLRRRRRDWTMRFAAGGEEALALLGDEPIDVVVSDMRMPGMDGVELLGRIRADNPDVVRIILSGQADKDQAVRSISVTHQYLSKPCDPVQLETTLDRICSLRELVAPSDLRTRIGGLAGLPVTPRVRGDLEKALAAGGNVAAVADVCARDAALAAKLLQLSNSGYLRTSREIESVKEAVEVIGLAALDALIARHGFLDETEAAGRSPAGEALPAGPPEEILHHVGKLVLSVLEPERATSAWELARRTGRSTLATERESLGAGHAEVGAYLLGLWGLPPRIVAAVADGHGIDGADVAARVGGLAPGPSAARR